ncbi:MAG: YdcF family protein [Acidobacteriota bacterium]
MGIESILRFVVERFVLPPACLLWLGLIGLLFVMLRRDAQRYGRSFGLKLLGLAMLGLFVLSLPVTATLLARSLDRYPHLDLDDPTAGGMYRADAIVVLGAGYRTGGEEWGGDVVSPAGLDRLRYGAALHRRTGKPLLVTGYTAPTMVAAMEGDLSTPVRWTEDRSYTTWENAAYSAEILHAAGIRRVYLVTHFWHMPRSMIAFTRHGLDPIPAPMGFTAPARSTSLVERLLPATAPLAAANAIYHEWVGIVWYQIARRKA